LLQMSVGAAEFGAKTVITSSNGIVAVTFDSSQDATFAGHAILSTNKRMYFEGAGSDTYIYYNGTTLKKVINGTETNL